MTTATRTPPHHNNLTCYTDYDCRLPECLERYREWNRTYSRRRRTTGHAVFVDAGPVRAHIHSLYAAGFSDYRIANLAGTTPPTIHALGKRSYAKDRGRQRRLTQAIAERILAINPAKDQPGRVVAHGTRRRMQALVTAGWPLKHIGARAGISEHNAYQLLNRPVVNLTTALAISRTYDELRQLRPERSGIRLSSVRRARNHGKTRKWAPISYWGKPDHPIDDPDFLCDYGIPAAQLIAEEARFLMEFGGLDVEAAANRLGRSYGYITQALSDYPEVRVMP